ncbi:MAG: ATP synthase F1 subunit gamma, partial [Bacteroidia bacterium]|nr:ATP synthase F1 subunit gamma [Bacteroidia bacterium]
MANLKEVRNRITSVGSTMQITSAMKMVSAAKLKRAQDAIVQMRPYANKLKEILENVSATMDTSDNAYARKSSVKNVLLICITSNRGLAGAFNSSVIKKTWSLVNGEYKGTNITILPVGKKAHDAFKRTSYNIKGNDLPMNGNELFDKLTYENVAPFAEQIMTSFVNKQFDKVVLVYNQFKNAAVQIATDEQFLPVAPAEGGSNTSKTEYDFEPNKEFIVKDLIPRS